MDQSPISTKVEVSEAPLDSASLAAWVGSDRAGANVVFVGTARDHSPGRSGVTHLEYEAYPEHVVAKIEQIVEEARAKWQLLRVAVAHRTGRVDIGEASVVVAVSSAHRGVAFDAAEFVIDELKQRAPIWKKETWAGGAEWVEGA